MLRRARRRVTDAGTGLSSAPFKTATIAEWHKHAGDASDRKALVAAIVRCDQSRRTVQLQNAKAGAPKENRVMEFLVSDGTSIIEVSVCGEQGEAVLNAYAALEEEADGEGIIVADMESSLGAATTKSTWCHAGDWFRRGMRASTYVGRRVRRRRRLEGQRWIELSWSQTSPSFGGPPHTAATSLVSFATWASRTSS